MAASCNVSIIAELSGLGKLEDLAEKFSVTGTPARALYQYMVQAVADTEEVLEVGDVATIALIILKCISNDVDIDTSFNTTFSAEIEVQEGEVAVFKPAGTVYIKNDDAAEQSTIEYIVIGSA